jgi:hypothetical protein
LDGCLLRIGCCAAFVGGVVVQLWVCLVQLLWVWLVQLVGGVAAVVWIQGSASVLLGARSLPLVGTEIIPRRVANVKGRGIELLTNPSNFFMMAYNYIAMSGRDIDREEYNQILDIIKLKVTEKFEFPPEVVRIDGVVVATLGNFSASVGKPKSKKTFNVSAIVAAALSGRRVLNYEVTLPEGRNRVLYIDTEQSRCHCHKVMTRIFRLAGLPTDREDERLIFLLLREYSPRQRRQIISLALAEDERIGLVIIDGCRDLLLDINDPSESVDVINDLMRWSSFYNMHIHTVLHFNKHEDQVRGHIGTELTNKAETVIQVAKSAFDGNISEVKPMQVREREFVPFAFRINEDGLPELVRKYSFEQERAQSKNTLTDELHMKVLARVFADGPISSYKVLIERLQAGYAEVGYKRGRNVCVDLNKHLMGKGVIVKVDDGYVFNPDELDV